MVLSDVITSLDGSTQIKKT